MTSFQGGGGGAHFITCKRLSIFLKGSNFEIFDFSLEKLEVEKIPIKYSLKLHFQRDF
jgi:hypothetical protein